MRKRRSRSRRIVGLAARAPADHRACHVRRLLPRPDDHPLPSASRRAVELTLTDRFVDLIDEAYDAVIRLGRLSD